jgi:hypothetical protein
VIPVEGTTEIVGLSDTVACVFDSIYISDTTGEWICDLNLSYDYTLNSEVTYIKPRYRKYPIRISNGDGVHASGNVQGLFLPKDSNGGYNDVASIILASMAYKRAFLDFLTNNQTKLLKTYDGHVWRVGINSNPQEIFNRTLGASEIKFDWTEISDPPDV